MQRHLIFVCTSALALCAAISIANPEGPPAYQVTSFTIDSGGGTSNGNDFTMTGTIGQPDAGGPLAGGTFTVQGGFWHGGTLGTPCIGDLDNTNDVALTDLLSLLAAWGECPGCPQDLDGDGAVTATDLLILLGAWGPCPE